MIQQVVQIGAEKLIVSGDTLQEVIETAGEFRLMNYRLFGADDATFRLRKNDGGDFLEMYSPSLRASKMVSKRIEDGSLYIGADTPFLRYQKSETEGEEGTNFVRFDVLTDQIRELGWTEADLGKFVPATRVKVKGKTRAWTWKPVR